MATDTREPNRNYHVPDPANFVSEEFPRLKLALQAIGVDVAGLLTSIAGKAATVHTHTIAQVTGLQTALDAKQNTGTTDIALEDLSDVTTVGGADFQVLARLSGVWRPWTFDVTYAAGWDARLAVSSIDAAQLTSGLLDPARIPVLASTNTIVSSNAIANLATAQQNTIVQGTHVTTTDGRRWIYKGSGTKTLEVSYIELADVTPDWSIIASKPTNITNLAGLSAAALGVPYFTGSGSAMAVQGATAFGISVLNAADAAALRTLAALGASATLGTATSAECRTGTTTKVMPVDQIWGAAAEVTITWAVTVTLDLATFINAAITLGGATTVGPPTNLKQGQTGRLRFIQDATGGRTVSWDAVFDFDGGVAPSFSTAVGAIDIAYYDVLPSGKVFVTLAGRGIA
jgi:hypothetical protein